MPTIRLRRNTGATAVAPPLPSTGTSGEPRFALNGFTGMPAFDPTTPCELIIDDGSANRDLVSARRQVQLAGPQTITGVKTVTGAGAINYTTAANMTFGDGTNGQVLTKGAGNAVNWSPVTPFTGVESDATLRGTGVPGASSPLGIDPAIWGIGLTITADVVNIDRALANDVAIGTNNITFLTPQNLLGALGVPVGQLKTNEQTVVPAINELFDALAGATHGLVFTGSYNADTDEVNPAGPGASGPLPTANADREGWFVIVEIAGMGINNAPRVQLDVGDWIICAETPGTPGAFEWFPLHVSPPSIIARIVTVSPQVGGADNVQDALEYLDSQKLEAVLVDTVSIVGDGATVPLRVEIVDGGTFGGP